jgi:type I site-specific restriction endonuclease
MEELKYIEKEGKTYVFDNLRKKYILLTPEEWVRQNFINSLIYQKKYTKNLIKIESGLKYNKLLKRTDILVYDKMGKPYLLVECKAQDIELTQQTVEQASRYNLVIRAPFLCITNGVKTFCFEIDFENNTSKQLKVFPDAP